VLRALDAVAARRWADLSVAALAEDREAIDRINVYPVADGDTGTNLLQTMRSAVGVLRSTGPETVSGVLAALAKGALAGAQGNSGMLLSQVLRGIAEELHDVPDVDGAALRRALERADRLATDAVCDPMEGTLLSVLHAAARAAETCGSDRLDLVVREATVASARALEETTAQLPALTDAGVVDAGGRGLVVVLDALHAVVHDGARLAPKPPTAGSATTGHKQNVSGYAYEVMYLLSDTETDRTAWLREELGRIGDCVSVIGDGSEAWAVHVHCDDIGSAIERGIEVGRVHQIKVARFADQPPSDGSRAYRVEHAVLACVRGEVLAELFRAEGAGVVPVGTARPVTADDLVAAIDAAAAAHVVLLPNDDMTAALAEQAAGRAVRAGTDVVVVPTASPVQGLAALAVHDPGRRRADDAVAMAEAAAATRRGELAIATSEALTWAGRCQAGDVLGLVDGEVVLIGGDLVASARDLLDRMLVAGGELVTALVDASAPPSLADEMAGHLRRTHPEVELTCYPGGDLGSALLLGVE
jgi:uncharacterized protein